MKVVDIEARLAYVAAMQKNSHTVMALAIVLVVAACGSSSSSKSTGTTVKATATTAKASGKATASTTSKTTTTTKARSTSTTLAQNAGLQSCSGGSGKVTIVSVVGMECAAAQTEIGSVGSITTTFTTADGFQCGRIDGTDTKGRWACKTGDREFAFDYSA